MQCPMKYKLKYVDGNYVNSEAIALDVGTIVHKAMEEKYKAIMEGKEVDYNRLLTMVQNGTVENHRRLLGINEIQDRYESIYNEVNKKSNMTYHDKMEVFYDYFLNGKLEDDWKCVGVEVPFEFVYDDRVILHGFIDRIDKRGENEYRPVDYKTANKVYEHKDLTTPLQLFIYELAIKDMFGDNAVVPERIYDMVFHNTIQYGGTKGFEKRGFKKLDKVLDQIEEAEKTGAYTPKSTPLCYWCDFSPTNPNANPFTEGLCRSFSLWTPENKTFEVNQDYKINMGEIEF